MPLAVPSRPDPTRRQFAIASAAAALGLAACTTPYQPMGGMGGFAQRQLAPDRWSVEFRGNGNTPATLVANMYLYRCAELTLQQGFEVFRHLRPDDADGQAWAMALAGPGDDGPAAPTGFKSGGGTVRYITVPSAPVTLHRMTGTVRMGRRDQVPANVQVWDARAVVRVLEPVVRDGGSRRAMAPEEVARLAMVAGRAPSGATAGTSLDDLRRLLQAQEP